MTISQNDLDNWYAYHPPTPEQVEKYQAIRAKAKELAELFHASAPPSADTTAAHRKLRDTVMAMNLAIACNENAADTAEDTAKSAEDKAVGSGLGGSFERGPAATAAGSQFGFRL